MSPRVTCIMLALILAFDSCVSFRVHGTVTVTSEKSLSVHGWKSDAWLQMYVVQSAFPSNSWASCLIWHVCCMLQIG